MHGTVRVLKGQQAAVHALLFVGVSLCNACKIVSVHPRRMRPFIADDMIRQALPIPINSMEHRRHRLYRKMRESLPRSKAYAEAMR